MGEPAKHTWISVADYLEGEKYAEVRHEYVNGEVFTMVGATKVHNLISLNMAILLRSQLSGKPCRVYMADVKIHVKTKFEERFYYPDLRVECRPFTDHSYYSERPKLIIEVLSHSTERDDRSDKFYAYRRLASLEEYVLVAQDEQRVEIYRCSEGWNPTVYKPGRQRSTGKRRRRSSCCGNLRLRPDPPRGNHGRSDSGVPVPWCRVGADYRRTKRRPVMVPVPQLAPLGGIRSLPLVFGIRIWG